MKIKLLKDHRGRETKDSWFVKGTVLEYDDEDPMAEVLLKNGWAEVVEDAPKPEVEDAPALAPKRGRKATK